MITGASPARTGPRLAVRVFWAMGLVVLAGATTMIVVSLLLAPTLFQRHLDQAGVLKDPGVTGHVEEAFALAALTSTAVGVMAALAVAAAGSLFVARRLTDPIAVTARTAGRLAAGDYSARVEPPQMGPELAGLADSVNALAGRLEDTERTRIRLMADLAHELRTPVASIEATVEAIADQVLPADPETLTTLTEQAHRLSRLIGDLAAVSRAEERSFRVDVTQVDLIETARACAASAAASYARARVELLTPTGAALNVIADQDRLVEVIDQLLANALQHCPPGSQVTLATRRDGATGQLAVRDTGSGFDPADSEALFHRFYRADPSRANRTGSGIGLTIARALIHAQGGTLTAYSPGPGAGATLTLSLPTADQPPGSLRV